MKTIKELEKFYFENLKLTLDKVEEDRTKSIGRMFKHFFICTLLFVILAVILMMNVRIEVNGICIFGAAYFMSMQGIYSSAKSKYNDNFKDSIIKPLIHSIDESLVYYKNKCISIDNFIKTDLFKKPDVLSGDDYVCGEIDGVKIEFSDVNALTKSEGKDKKVEYKSFFRGFFIKASFNKNFQGKTLVLPDSTQSIFSSLLSNWLEFKDTKKGRLLTMDNDEFEREFVVYSTDQIEARYILTPTMMERLLDFKKKSGYPLYISFVDDSIHAVIGNNKNSFEATLFQSVLDYGVAFEYIQNLHLASAIISDLKLNAKLWGKK